MWERINISNKPSLSTKVEIGMNVWISCRAMLNAGYKYRIRCC